MNLPWIASWWHPSESFWSVANKLAFVLSATVSDVLELVLGPVHKRRESIWFARFQTAADVHRSLRVPMDHPDGHMFAALDDAPSLQAREPWLLRVRYCPECIRGFVHRSTFQDSRVGRCSLHDCALLDYCEHCSRAVDPLCPAPWTCSSCSEPLAVPGNDWPKAFSRRLSGGRKPAAVVPAFTFGQSYYPETWYLLQLVFEEHAALAHAFLSGHPTCAFAHEALSAGRFNSTTFECPLAAALMLLARRLGLTSSSLTGGWPGHRYVASGSAIGALQYFVAGFDRSQLQATVRLAVRAWFLDCLDACLAAARSGTYQVSWSAQAEQLHQQKARVSYGALSRLVQSADPFCRIRSKGTRKLRRVSSSAR